ncbi:hypothetical protein KUCAC02_020218, partial [Chaenocephalus aceratus]
RCFEVTLLAQPSCLDQNSSSHPYLPLGLVHLLTTHFHMRCTTNRASYHFKAHTCYVGSFLPPICSDFGQRVPEHTGATHCQFVPHYLFWDQHVLKQVAEERAVRLIAAAMLMGGDGVVCNRIGRRGGLVEARFDCTGTKDGELDSFWSED